MTLVTGESDETTGTATTTVVVVGSVLINATGGSKSNNTISVKENVKFQSKACTKNQREKCLIYSRNK